MLTEVRDCDMLIVVTSSTFLNRKRQVAQNITNTITDRSKKIYMCT